MATSDAYTPPGPALMPIANLALPPLRAMLTWLDGLPYGEVIGERLNITRCAVQAWLSTVFPGHVAVDEEVIEVSDAAGAMHRLPTPNDYRALLMQLDYLGGNERTIRVDEARMVLREVLHEYRDDD